MYKKQPTFHARTIRRKTEISRENIPPSTAYKITIACNEKSYTFDKKAYKYEFLSEYISQNDWNNILSEASKVMGSSWSKKRVNDQIKLPKLIIGLACLSVLLTVVYMVTLYLAGNTDDDNESAYLMAIAIVSISSGSVLALGLAIYNFTRKVRKFKTLDDIMQNDIDNYLFEINAKYKNKLEFIYIPTTKWIECNIMMKKDTDNDERKKFINNNEPSEEIEGENKCNNEELQVENGAKIITHNHDAFNDDMTN